MRVKRLHARERLRLKFVMNNTGTLPAKHVSAGLLLHVITEMAVRRPDDFLAQTVQMLNQFNGDA